jgi:phosphotriesterase-related protein
MIRTVTGDIELGDGPVLVHEHLQIDLSHNKGPETVLGPSDAEDIIADLKKTAGDHNVRAIGDLSVPGSGREPRALRRIAEQSGVAVVCATGFYWDPMPAPAAEGTKESVRDTMIAEIRTGIGDTGIRCGVIKIGTDVGEQSTAVERVFRAAALAARETGAAIITHTSTPDQGQWHVDVLEDEGADLGRVLISHQHTAKNFADIVALTDRGVYVGFDQIGFAKGPTPAQIADLTRQMCEHGLAKQLIVSSDVARRVRLHRHGGTSYGTVFSQFVPLLRELGVTDAQIKTLLFDNPRRLLTLAH